MDPAEASTEILRRDSAFETTLPTPAANGEKLPPVAPPRMDSHIFLALGLSFLRRGFLGFLIVAAESRGEE